MTAPSLDVIVVSFNTRADLSSCLESMYAHPPAGLRDVFVVDNASADGSIHAVRSSWPQAVTIALERNVGFGAANNVAIRRASADLSLFLNSDTMVAPGAIDALVARLAATGAVAAGPRLVDSHGRPEVSFGDMLTPVSEIRQLVRVRASQMRRPWAERYVAGLVSRERDVDWVSGACLLVRRTAALDAGLFDERYFMYEEDVDFCAALRARGGRVLFTPHATVTHLGGRSMRQTSATSTDHYDRSHVAFYEKHAPVWAPMLRAWLRVRGRSVR
jgi:GT2 family glycosyltransferase